MSESEDNRKRTIEFLKKVYGVQTEKEVIEKALRIAIEAHRASQETSR